MFNNRSSYFVYIIITVEQTAKINQGNTALKRVVESIANGDSHVPFRDSKLTMLLQVQDYKISHSLIPHSLIQTYTVKLKLLM